MGKPFHESVERFQKWLQGRDGKPLKWCYVDETGGRVAEDQWFPFVSMDRLPRGKKLLVRTEDSKAGIHVRLVDTPPAPAAPVAPSSELVRDSEDARMWRQRSEELTRKADELRNRERELNQREFELLGEQRRFLAESSAIGHKQDQRTATMVTNLKTLEDSMREQAEERFDFLLEIDKALQRAQTAEEKSEVAAAVTYAADRVLGALELLRVKRWEDLPKETLADFQRFLTSRAERRYFEHLPDIVAKVCNSFMQLSGHQRKAAFESMVAAMQEANRAAATEQAAEGAPQHRPPTRPPA